MTKLGDALYAHTRTCFVARCQEDQSRVEQRVRLRYHGVPSNVNFGRNLVGLDRSIAQSSDRMVNLPEISPAMRASNSVQKVLRGVGLGIVEKVMECLRVAYKKSCT
jgi:hypothetical protein